MKNIEHLIKVGFWRDFADQISDLPFPVENSSDRTEEEKQKIVYYLNRNTHNRIGYRGMSICRICDCFNGSQDVFDDKYLWPSELAHYVKDHNVKLDEEFENWVLSK